MPRNFSVPAVIFSLSPLGENNSTVRLITPESGIMYATLYGGPKSKLRPLVSPWNAGLLYLYINETTHAAKISDFDVKKYHLSFRTSLYKTYAASLSAEIVIRTKCAGSAGACFTLLSGFLDGLDLSTESQAHTGTLRFLWRYLGLLGIQPDASHCASCGRDITAGKFTGIGVSYETAEHGFLCPDCVSATGSTIPVQDRPFFLTGQAVQYLAAVSEKEPAEVRTLALSGNSENQLKQLLFYLTEQAAGSRLHSIQTGTGIL